jgi:hypothetical protein
MTETPRLRLPLLAPAQAQKHVTHNEALMEIDALTQISVLGRLSAPPVDAQEGARVLVAGPATGAFVGREGALARLEDGRWRFSAPQPGWLAFDEQAGHVLAFSAGSWAPALAPVEVNPVAMVGINAAADASRRLTVRSDGALFTQDESGSGDMRLALNKRAVAHVASVVMQTGYSGRVEIGAIGDDQFSVKTSSDGGAWTTAMTVSASAVTMTGAAAVAGGLGVGRAALGAGSVGLHADAAPAIVFSNGAASAPTEIGRVTAGAGAISIAGPAGSPICLTARPDLARVGVLTAAPVHALSVQGAVGPQTDNAYALGAAGHRWSQLYVASGVVSSSDARWKTDVVDCPLGLDFLRDLRPRLYRWRDGETTLERTEAGELSQTVRAGRRLHLGLLAQDVRAALTRAGLDCGLWTLADPEDPDSRQGLRYEQMIAPLVVAVQELARRLDQVEAALGQALPASRPPT